MHKRLDFTLLIFFSSYAIFEFVYMYIEDKRNSQCHIIRFINLQVEQYILSHVYFNFNFGPIHISGFDFTRENCQLLFKS